MRFSPTQLHELLRRWGVSQHQLPHEHEVMKSKIIEAFPSRFEEAHLTAPSRRRLPWLSLAFTGLAVLTLFVSPDLIKRRVGPPTYSYGTMGTVRERGGRQFSESQGAASFGEALMQPLQKMVAPDYYPYPSPEVPITDSREFLKTFFQATIKTRRIEELGNRITTMIRGHGGRVDQVSLNPRWGSLSYVIPADRFEAFKAEIKGLVRARFITETIGQENLLPQKQVIEQQTEYTARQLGEVEEARRTLITNHQRTVRAFQSQLSLITKELDTLAREVTDDPARKQEIETRKSELTREQLSLKQRMSDENARYARELNSFDSQIRNLQTQIEQLDKQDQNLLDTVATVRGTISLEWVSILQIVKMYLPGHWLTYLFVLAALALYIRHRRRTTLELPL